MIHAELKNGSLRVRMGGDITDIMVELTEIIRAANENFTGSIGQTGSKVMIAECGRLAFMEREEMKNYMSGNAIEHILNAIEDEFVSGEAME